VQVPFQSRGWARGRFLVVRRSRLYAALRFSLLHHQHPSCTKALSSAAAAASALSSPLLSSAAASLSFLALGGLHYPLQLLPLLLRALEARLPGEGATKGLTIRRGSTPVREPKEGALSRHSKKKNAGF